MVPGTQQLSAALKDVNNAISDQLEPSMQWVFGQCCPVSEHNRPSLLFYYHRSAVLISWIA